MVENQVAKHLELIEIEDEMKRSYIDYAMSVIVGRALPDVRDGLKPVHRRILWGMYDMGMHPNRPYKKCARIVGEVLGKYHPHGDTAVYDTLVRLAQDFSSRYVLVDGHGNFGSVDGDSPAAMRYTEARLASLSMELLADIDKETVDFVPNFDESLVEPAVLPARVPNLLVNGSSGIAVGMSTNIPPHNLGEVIDAVVHLIESPEAEISDLMKHIKGPDFPTGGIVLGRRGFTDAYTTGRGSIRVRGRAEIEEGAGSKVSIIITEIPFQVNKARLAEKIAELAREKKITEISDLRDESDSDGMRLVIELKRDAIPQIVMNKLYRHTQLETTFGVIMLALVDGVPRILNLKEVLEAYLEHQREVIRRRTAYELRKAEERAHVLEGLLIALAHLDEVIALIRSSADVDTARKGLIDRFELSEVQAQAILDMRLQRLTQLESEKVQREHADLVERIEYLRGVLADPEKVDGILKDELVGYKEKFGDRRRTSISRTAHEIEIEDLIAAEEVVLTVTHSGYIKRMPVDVYRGQRRGGKGVTGANLKEGDWVEHLFVAMTHDNLLLFTNLGKVYRLKVYQIPEASRTARGQALVNVLPLSQGERVVAGIAVPNFSIPEGGERNLVMATQAGLIKKTTLEAYDTARRDGIIALGLREGDRLVAVKLTDGDREILMLTRRGKSIRFHECEARPMGRTATGVRGIKLDDGDELLAMVILEEEERLFMVTERGYGKRTQYRHFPAQHRGGKGVIAMRMKKERGEIAAARGVRQDEEILLISAEGQVIRIPVDGVSSLGRQAQGVRVMGLRDKDRVSAIAIVEE